MLLVRMRLPRAARLIRYTSMPAIVTTNVLAPTWGVPTHPGDTLGTVEELLVPVGAMVLEGETMAVVETDKVAAEVRAPHDGVVKAVLVTIGDEVKEKQPIYEMVMASADASGGGDSRQWAYDLLEQKLAEAREAELNWQAWQRRWKEQQRKRMAEQQQKWERWQRRNFERPWWRRQHDSRWERRWSGQQQQQQQQGASQRAAPGSSASSGATATLGEGPIKRTLLATDHYGRLGVSRAASTAMVKAAFRKLAHKLHPDTYALHAVAPSGGGGGGVVANHGEDEREATAAREAFLRAQEAYSVLANGRRRREYDRDLRW